MRRTWKPLMVHLQVEALPRGACVEVQPFALTSQAGQVRKPAIQSSGQ